MVVIGDAESDGEHICVLSPQDFVARLGGSVYSFLPLEPEYPEQLLALGKNQLPEGLIGKADDLFEIYMFKQA